jgi:hypothetical protein
LRHLPATFALSYSFGIDCDLLVQSERLLVLEGENLRFLRRDGILNAFPGKRVSVCLIIPSHKGLVYTTFPELGEVQNLHTPFGAIREENPR